MNTLDDILSPGDRGKSISRLAPMGKALINNEYYEVSTNGEFVDENQPIEVIKIEGSRVLVKKI
jgi:membrane-bound ClpP family serine protease